MLLAVNVSNSNILLGVFRDNDLLFKACISTSLAKSVDEYAVGVSGVLALHNCQREDIHGVILSCVVPALSNTIKSALSYLYNCKVFTVGPGLKTGLKIKAENPTLVGASLVCQSVAILEKYPPPCLLISMGTALSIFAIDETSTFVGGSILPGVGMGAKALSQYTAQLPQIDLSQRVASVIGVNSAQSIQSGLIFGTACAIDGMIERFKETLGDTLTCVATGELSASIIPHCKSKIFYEENLVLEGLKIIYNRNIK